VMKGKMGKEGLLGKLIVSFPVILFVFVIMGIFLFLAAASSVTGSSDEAVFSQEFVSGENLMLKKVTFNGEVITVMDAIYRNYDGSRSSLGELKAKMKSLYMNKVENNLFLVIVDEDELGETLFPDIYLEYRDGEATVRELAQGSLRKWYGQYESAGGLRAFSFVSKDNERYYVKFYYGPCITDKEGACIRP